MWDSKYFQWGIGILLFLAIIYVGSLVSFVFRPVVVVFETLSMAFLISGVLYYFSSPLSDWLQGRGAPRTLAIVAVFFVLIAVIVLMILAVVPILLSELTRLAVSLPDKIMALEALLAEASGHPAAAQLVDPEALEMDRILDGLADILAGTIAQVTRSFVYVVGVFTNFLATVLIVPFLLYYFLKERGKGTLSTIVQRYGPRKLASRIDEMLFDINRMLGFYFQGVTIVCLCVGLMALLGFIIIDLDFALTLAIIIGVTNIIPYLGPFIGAIPAVLVGLAESPGQMILVIIVITVLQQIESLFISPQVMGRKVSLSPLAVILVIMVAGRLAGLLGIILAVPVFTVAKIIVGHVYAHWQTLQEEAE